MEQKKVTTKMKTKALNKAHVRNCYYDDNLCKGKIVPVNSFKEYLCEKCAEEDNSIIDEPLDHDFSIGEK